MLPSVKICLSSLGCAKNLVDSEIMLGSLSQAGAEFTSDQHKADIQIINTCSFINKARDESYSAIDEAIRWKAKKRHRKVIVAGCLSQRMPEEVKKKYPGIDLLIGLDEIHNIHERLEGLLKKIPGLNTFSATSLPVYLYNENTPRLLATPEHYCYLKIAEGCNMKCSFCAIPTFRGQERSRTIDSIAIEAQKLLDQGVRELILVSQNSSRYGLDLRDGTNVVELLKRLDNLNADEYWLRLLYLYPTSVTDELINAFASCQHLTRYIDIPLQHASNNVLKRMRRGIRKERIEGLLTKFREQIPNVIIRTTFLVGHPGEEETDFQILKEFVEEQRFDRFGVFTYSHEKNTHAYQYSDYADKEIAENRRNELMLLQQGISKQKNDSMVGNTVRIIIDDLVNGEDGKAYGIGRTEGDAPVADNSIHFTCDQGLDLDAFCNVRINAAEAYDLYATLSD